MTLGQSLIQSGHHTIVIDAALDSGTQMLVPADIDKVEDDSTREQLTAFYASKWPTIHKEAFLTA